MLRNSSECDLIGLKILAYLKKLGPEYAKLSATRLGLSLQESREQLQKLAERRIVKY